MEDREITALLADFESVWQRVSPPPENAAELQAEVRPAEQMRPELCSGRTPRWFGVIEA